MSDSRHVGPLVTRNPLAPSLVDVLHELVQVKRDLALRREIVTAAVHLLHAQAEELWEVRAQHQRLLDEHRRDRGKPAA